MAATQTVLFTVLPRGISVNADTLPVSVFVSPRLMGGTTLGAFPDWVTWTGLVKQSGLTLRLRSGTQHVDVRINTAPLKPKLWEALFNEHTFVRSRTFNDYSNHGIMSFSVRESLSVLKTVYQEASVALALPDDPNSDRLNRHTLKRMLDGLDVHWSGRQAPQWRQLVRSLNSDPALTFHNSPRALQGELDAEGAIVPKPGAVGDPDAFQSVAIPFSVFHHMPTPDRERAGELEIDPHAFDFHQAVGALESHPELLRALGLVFDVELPRNVLALTPLQTYGTVSVETTSVDWQVPTQSPPLETAYAHFAAGEARVFHAASRTLTGSSPAQIVGLMHLDPQRYGLTQVDVDGGMHKAIMVAETSNRPDPERNLNPSVQPLAAPNPEVFDPEATLPALRSGGLQLYVDRRGLTVLDAVKQSKSFNDALESGGVQPRPFFAEDLTRGYRLDIWDSRTKKWHSLHRRSGSYRIGDDELPFETDDEEGFFQLAATQPAPGATPADKDLYVHEAIARWAGWSLSVPMPGKALSRHADPDKAVPPDGDDPAYRTDEAVTAFKVRAEYKVLPGSLPSLRCGTRYRIRARAVDLAGNSLRVNDRLAHVLALLMGLPRDPEGVAYLRFEPVDAPLVVIRDERAVTLPGSAVDRLVIRTFNADPTQDDAAADLIASDRHILPPRTSVEMGERLGMFDGSDGKLKSDAATYQLAVDRDAGELSHATIEVAGKTDAYPLETGADVALPYLPDPLSRGAAIRDLPGSTPQAIGRAEPGAGPASPIEYEGLSDPNPRPGSTTLIPFNAGTDWEQTAGFRFELSEPSAASDDPRPIWDPATRVLTAFLPKARTTVVPLTSYLTPDDLRLMGVWQWLREYVDRLLVDEASPQVLLPGFPIDRVAHVLQRAVEGGHWMLTPPRLLTLVHAVQQPIGRPQFAALNVDHMNPSYVTRPPLQTARVRGRIDPVELYPISAWRRLGETDAFLIGALKIHAASSAKVDLHATWTDPVDDPKASEPDETKMEAHVDELPLPRLGEDYLRAPGADDRYVGYCDPENDQIAMVRAGDRTPQPARVNLQFVDAAPRHAFGDTKHHRVTYTATASSRYREYFPQDPGLDFTRTSAPVIVEVPASERPLAPDIAYVVPTFGWQRQHETNIKRSVRFGGGLRVYLNRGWYSSGAGELLGVALWNSANGTLNNETRSKFKPYFTQWGNDPIWDTAGLLFAPGIHHFPDAVTSDSVVSLEEATAAISPTEPGRVDVVGFEPQFDKTRGLWFADLTINLSSTYAPFVRLALVRYQPNALDDARISRVVLADFSQLTPERSAVVTADPHHPLTLLVTVSGVAPRGPRPSVPIEPRPERPTEVRVRVQRQTGVAGDLGWEDVPATVAKVTRLPKHPAYAQPDLGFWAGAVTFAAPMPAGTFRLLIEEFEYVSANYVEHGHAPRRLIYAETFPVDVSMA